LSLYNNRFELDPFLLNKITREEIEIKGSWNSYSSPFPGKEWYMALEFIEKKLLKLKPLITHRLEFKNAETDLPIIYFKLTFRTKS
jgi:L-iditol 2-dehydrogenase